MQGRDIIVVGASAGGVEALTQLARLLPADLPASIFVVLHVPAQGTSLLPAILTRTGPLPARHPDDGEEIRPGRIYVAPPDTHLLLNRGHVRLVRGPRENGHRPAIDPLFRTAARSYGNRVVGVILSGSLDDGSAGMVAVKDRGGVAIVQDPDEAPYPSMPRSTLEATAVDHRLPVAEIARALVRLVSDPVDQGGGEPMLGDMEMESRIAEMQPGAIHDEHRPGKPSGFGCPDCGGSLWEIEEGELVRFRCRIGHAWTANSLIAGQSEGVETALWSALRALEERAALCHRIADRLRSRNSATSAARFSEQAREARRRAEILRQVLLTEPTVEAELPAGDAGGGGAAPMDNPEVPIAAFDVVAVASSAGGLAALGIVLAAMPPGFPASIVLVQHLDPRRPSLLAEILCRRTPLKVRQAEDGDLLRPGVVFVAPPDRHLVVRPGGSLALTNSAQVHLVRPSADILFKSVALAFGPRAIAVILTGSGSDGADGARAVKAEEGTVIAQDGATSAHFSMPSAAIRTGCVDLVLPLVEIAPRLVALVTPEPPR